MPTAIRRLLFVAAIVICGGFAYFRLQGPHGWAEFQSTQKAIAKLDEENRKLESDVERRKRRNWDIQHNPSVLGDEIRDRTRKLGEGESEFITPESK